MATTTFTKHSAGKLVQKRFDFEAFGNESPSVRLSSGETALEPARAVPTRAVPTLAVPTLASPARLRRGECRHVGGALVSVLGKYGLTVDALLDEIERQKAQKSSSGVLVQ
jgi:hypothetical protein